MLHYKNNLILLAIAGENEQAPNLVELRGLLTECCIAHKLKHPELIAAINCPDQETRQSLLANVLFKSPNMFNQSEDKNLNALFEHIAPALPPIPDALIDTLCPQLLTLKKLSTEARATLQAFSELPQLFDADDSVQPLLQIVSGNEFFKQLAQSDQMLSRQMNLFFSGTFDAHLKLNDEKIVAAKRQALLDIPRESFHFKTPTGTIIATQGAQYTLSFITAERETGIAEMAPQILRTWPIAGNTMNTEGFVDELLATLQVHAQMDNALLDFWKTYLLNQEGPHGFPAIFFSLLEHVMNTVEGDGNQRNICLNALQKALRMKKLLFTFVSPHQFKMSWLNETDHFTVDISNKYLSQAAMNDDSLDPAQRKNNFKDITVTLEKFCIPLNEAEFANAIDIKSTHAHQNYPGITYQSCCDLFWQSYAAYVVKEKCDPRKNLIEKANDLPAVLLRCSEDPALKAQSQPEKKNKIKAIAFHWLQLLNSGQQSEIKKQMRWPVMTILEKLPDGVKMLFDIPIISFFSSFWRSATPTAKGSTSSLETAQCQGDTISLSTISSTHSGLTSGADAESHSSGRSSSLATAAASTEACLLTGVTHTKF